MSDFDDFDDDLASALRSRSAGPGRSVSAAHDLVLRRATTVRRRRAAMAGSGMAALAVAGVLLLPRGGTGEIGSADTPPSVAPTVVAPTSSAEPGDPTATTSPGASSTVATVPGPGSSGPTTTSSAPNATTATTVRGGNPGVTSTTAATTTISTTTPSTTTPTTSTTAASTSTSSTTVPAGVAPFSQTYTSTGGSISVTWNGTTLSLDAVNPAPDHEAEIEANSGTRVRVSFEGPAESRIEVRVEDDEVEFDID